MAETIDRIHKKDLDNQRAGTRVLAFLRGTKSARDLESVTGSSVVDTNLIEYISGDPDLTAAYDEGKQSGSDHMKKKKGNRAVINNS